LDDPDIQHGKVTFKHGGKETFDGFLARPKADGTFPAVLVIAGNRISEEYIPNTCAALALAGFVGLAPNIFHPLPDSAKTDEDYEKALKEHTKYDALQDIQVGADYLKRQLFVKARGMGIIGFCYGGRMAMLFGARSREIDALAWRIE
jgi:carboxymethylenebutenolidase